MEWMITRLHEKQKNSNRGNTRRKKHWMLINYKCRLLLTNELNKLNLSGFEVTADKLNKWSDLKWPMTSDKLDSLPADKLPRCCKQPTRTAAYIKIPQHHTPHLRPPRLRTPRYVSDKNIVYKYKGYILVPEFLFVKQPRIPRSYLPQHRL